MYLAYLLEPPHGLVGFDDASLDGGGDDLGRQGGFALSQTEVLAQRLVGPAFRDHPLQGAVQITDTNAIFAVHVFNG